MWVMWLLSAEGSSLEKEPLGVMNSQQSQWVGVLTSEGGLGRIQKASIYNLFSMGLYLFLPL